jgi:5-methyltetrahydropteroyltriglutamate--homocysteine methyltransferase
MAHAILPTTVVGSTPQPEWLIDRQKLTTRMPPRIRMTDLWRIPEPQLEAAQDDATRLAIRDLENAGIDIITDGEIRRESYSNRFAAALDGVDIDNPGEVISRTGKALLVPRVVGPIRRARPVELRDAQFLRANTERRIKITVPGPFTMSVQAKNEHYKDDEEMAMDYAVAVNQELRDLKAAGVDVIQLDEPWMQARPAEAEAYGIRAVNRALEGIEGATVLHLCFGYAHVVPNKPNAYTFLTQLAACNVREISIEAAQPHLDLTVLRELPGKTIHVGMLSLGDMTIETPETIAARIRAALEILPPDRLVCAPDCGMKYLPHAVAFGKLKALAEGAAIVRNELN